MEPAVWTAIAAGGPAVIVIVVLLVYGVPKYLEIRAADQAREEKIQETATKLAKEGGSLVIANMLLTVEKLEKRCEKLEERCERVETKNDTLEMQHRECQEGTAELRAAKEALEERVEEQDKTIAALKSQNAEQGKELSELKLQMEELKKQQGIWQAIQATETKARIQGDAAKESK